jgi:hypothetical protein
MSARIVVRTKSIPLATSNLFVTDPCSTRNALCNLACLNSQPKSHTSSSSTFLVMPFAIKGDIHETVAYCHGVKLSSGVRSSTLGAAKVGLMSLFGNLGSRSGVFNTITMPRRAGIKGMAPGVEKPRVLWRKTSRSSSRPMYSINNDMDAALGRSMMRIAIAITCIVRQRLEAGEGDIPKQSKGTPDRPPIAAVQGLSMRQQAVPIVQMQVHEAMVGPIHRGLLSSLQ